MSHIKMSVHLMSRLQWWHAGCAAVNLIDVLLLVMRLPLVVTQKNFVMLMEVMKSSCSVFPGLWPPCDPWIPCASLIL